MGCISCGGWDGEFVCIDCHHEQMCDENARLRIGNRAFEIFRNAVKSYTLLKISDLYEKNTGITDEEIDLLSQSCLNIAERFTKEEENFWEAEDREDREDREEEERKQRLEEMTPAGIDIGMNYSLEESERKSVPLSEDLKEALHSCSEELDKMMAVGQPTWRRVTKEESDSMPKCEVCGSRLSCDMGKFFCLNCEQEKEEETESEEREV